MIDLKSMLETIKYNGGTSPLETGTRITGNQQQATENGQGNQAQNGQQQGQLASILSKIFMSGGTPVA